MRARFGWAAELDLAWAKTYYDTQFPGLGSDFLDEVEAALQRIEAFPHAWQNMSENTRRCRLNRFPYGLVYRVRDDIIVIVAVAHLHSEPSQWLERSDD